jgi:hypothetical protein
MVGIWNLKRWRSLHPRHHRAHLFRHSAGPRKKVKLILMIHGYDVIKPLKITCCDLTAKRKVLNPVRKQNRPSPPIRRLTHMPIPSSR